MRVYVIPAQGTPRDYWMENNLYHFQALVGGYIQTCAPAELRARGIELLCNEEGVLSYLPVNENLYPFFYVGQLVAVGVDGEEFVSLTDAQADFIRLWVQHLH